MENRIKPDKKLVTKQWYILLTISFLIIVIGLLLQFLISLDQHVTPSQVAIILWPISGGLIFLMWIISAPIMVLWIKNLEYVIGEDRITIHKGILTKVHKNIPYRAITDFILHRSLYDRFLGIASIRIQTAGQTHTPTGYEGNLAGLVDWSVLHQSLRDKLAMLQPVSESLTTKESSSSPLNLNVLNQILEELKVIRKALEK